MSTVDLQILWRFPVEAVTAEGHPAKGKPAQTQRAIGVSADGLFIIVAMPAGEAVRDEDVRMELAFSLSEGIAHAEAVLAGNQQAMTRPGGMRIIAATAKILGGMLFEPAAADVIVSFAGKAEA